MLFSLFCISTAQAKISLNTPIKISTIAGAPIGSYISYRVLDLAISKLETDKKISPATAIKLKRLAMLKGLLYTSLVTYNIHISWYNIHYLRPWQLLYNFFIRTNLGTCLFGAELILFEKLKDLIF